MNFPFTDRLDYLTSMGNNFGYALAVEQLMGDDAKPPSEPSISASISNEPTRIASQHVVDRLAQRPGRVFHPGLVRHRRSAAN